ncbi:hypothetical protein CU031_2689 [Enterococcus faecium]|nr:hypothetical protein [Enterococcus faecium]MBK4805222.1 hypothetical protein [Enterococcus faecium]MBK4818582.1 hypothetical protein [Enterococcus faecium]MBK4868120.1 hypothetical protein [Enterococcus faecium]
MAGEYHSLESLSLVTTFLVLQKLKAFCWCELLVAVYDRKKDWEGLGCVVVIFLI